MESLAAMLGRVAIPTIRDDTLWVVSDYSFDNPASDFDVVGLLITSPNTLGAWNDMRREVRTRFFGDERSMSWKKLNSDSHRRAAFLPFLHAADQIHGLSIGIAFHRDPIFQFPPEDVQRFRASQQLSANWKPRGFEHMVRIAYCTALLIAGLSNPGQIVYWLSDQDAAFANEAMENDTLQVLMNFLKIFLPHELQEVHYGNTGHGVEPMFQEDLVAIPDLMCGAAAEIFTRIKRAYTDFPKIYTKIPKLKKREELLLKWYGNSDWPLTKYLCAFENRIGQNPSLGFLHPALLSRSKVFTGA